MSDFIFKPYLRILYIPFRVVIYVCFNAANACFARLSATLGAAAGRNQHGTLGLWDRMDSSKKRAEHNHHRNITNASKDP
jgi:hypothetical protein